MGHHSHDINDKTGQFVIVAAVAAFVGGLTALLVTPRSGKDTRSQIRTRVAAAKHDMQQRFHHAEADLEEELGTIEDEINQKGATAKAAAAETASKAKRRVRKVTDDKNDDLTDHIRKNGER